MVDIDSIQAKGSYTTPRSAISARHDGQWRTVFARTPRPGSTADHRSMVIAGTASMRVAPAIASAHERASASFPFAVRAFGMSSVTAACLVDLEATSEGPRTWVTIVPTKWRCAVANRMT